MTDAPDFDAAGLPPLTPEFQADIDAFVEGRIDEETVAERYLDRMGYGDVYRRMLLTEQGTADDASGLDD